MALANQLEERRLALETDKSLLGDSTSLPPSPTGLQQLPDMLVRVSRAPVVSIAMIRGRALDLLLGADEIPGDLAELYGYVNRSLHDAVCSRVFTKQATWKPSSDILSGSQDPERKEHHEQSPFGRLRFLRCDRRPRV